MIEQSVADDPRRVTGRIKADQRQDLRQHPAMAQDGDLCQPALPGLCIEPVRNVAVQRWCLGHGLGPHNAPRRNVAHEAADTGDVILPDQARRRMAPAIVRSKPRHDTRPDIIQRDAALDEPSEEMQRRAKMNMHRNRRKSGPDKMSAVSVEQWLVLPGIQQSPSSDRCVVFVHIVLRRRRHNDAVRRTSRLCR